MNDQAKLATHDTEWTRDIVCPHCGKPMSDSWEFHDGEECDNVFTECGWCEKEMLVSRHISITYSTKKWERPL